MYARLCNALTREKISMAFTRASVAKFTMAQNIMVEYDPNRKEFFIKLNDDSAWSIQRVTIIGI